MHTVGDVMSGNLLTIEAATSVTEAAARMCDRDVGAILVVAGDALIGILTERDVLRAVAAGGIDAADVASWMTRRPETVDADEPTRQAASIMLHGGFRHLPVLDGTKPVGIVSIRDLMRAVVDDESPRGV
jgi:signal-transduction protein with cAMP-binding, CBS, and nucleotidyltransferase domain